MTIDVAAHPFVPGVALVGFMAAVLASAATFALTLEPSGCASARASPTTGSLRSMIGRS